MVLVSSFYAFPCKNGSITKQTIFQIKMQSDAIQYFSERTLIYRKILNGIFSPIFPLIYGIWGDTGRSPRIRSFHIFLPTKNPACGRGKTKKTIWSNYFTQKCILFFNLKNVVLIKVTVLVSRSVCLSHFAVFAFFRLSKGR